MVRALLPRWDSGKESACQGRRHRRLIFDPWVGKIPWRRKWQSMAVFSPGKVPRTEEPGRPQSMGSWRVRQDWAQTHTHMRASAHTHDKSMCNFIRSCQTFFFSKVDVIILCPHQQRLRVLFASEEGFNGWVNALQRVGLLLGCQGGRIQKRLF